MNTDSSPQSPDPKSDEIVSKKEVIEVTEMDLWELDFDKERDSTASDHAPRTPGNMPAKRVKASKIRSKKTSDQKSKPTESVEPAEPLPVSKDSIGSADSKVAEKPVDAATPATDEDFFADFPELKDAEVAEESGEVENGLEEPIQEKQSPILHSVGTLSKIEKIAITGLCAALALGATLTVIHFYNRVPTRPLVAEEIDFPVSGRIVEIRAADTYWRKPVTSGENAEVVRWGTQLIPVLNMSLKSDSGAIRVFFRNEEGTVVGDGITRTVKGSAEVAVAATAGFDDIGMHTAYRTGDGKRWVVQVFEGPSATAPRERFHKVLETEISTTIK
ncbi:MAG: hypothetical protein RLZZ505_324 [Verrucomicrobiota bacterium]|jgi:hypothetical protein